LKEEFFMAINSAERLRRLYFHEEMDRPAVIIRWWGFRDDPTLNQLFSLMTERADWVEPWAATSLVHHPEFPWSSKFRNTNKKQYLLETIEDAEQYLELPMPKIGGDVKEYFRLKELVGERGIVLVHVGDNPGGHVAGLFGSEEFALMSVLEREIIHRLMQRQLDINLQLVDYLSSQGIGPYFGICGQEMIAPPLHGPVDFAEFNVRYDRVLSERIHAFGGRLNVHCHGSLKAVKSDFLELGADVLHCFEAAPMGDITPAEAKQAWRGRIALEGNIQIADMYEKSPDDIRAQVEALIRACFDDHRGLAVSPTASPFMRGCGADCYPQYLAMVDAVTEYAKR
jgi:hypothetical protein